MTEPNHYELLRARVDTSRVAAFDEYLHWLLKNDEWYSIDTSFLGFMEDYVSIANLISRKSHIHFKAALEGPLPGLKKPQKPEFRPYKVYDIGCATGLQHLLFDPRIEYVGVDCGNAPDPVFFRNGCSFVRGRFGEVVESLDVDRETSFGIANMSLLYGRDTGEIDLFDKTFKRKVIL